MLVYNTTSLDNKIGVFEARIYHDNPDIAFVTETWWNCKSIVNVDGYPVFRCDQENEKMGG